jgi:sugar lactone lactonase YvrE
MEINADVREVLHTECTLGEGALWDATRKVVWFVDIKKHHLWHYDPASGSNARAVAPEQIGWALPAEDGRLLCGLKDGLYTFDPEHQAFAKLSEIPGEPQTNRSNDACTDTHGRVWMGTMDDGEKADTGRFYVFDKGRVSPAGPDHVSITNGPAVSPDGKRIVFTDTLGKKIHVADLHDDGSLGSTRLFVDTAAHFPDAFPDGPVFDAEGFLWTGLYAGDRIARFTPDGKLDATVAMPTSNLTKLCFGGEDLKTVYVTSARAGLSAEKLAAQPLAGSLLAFESPVAGFVGTRVKLT